MISIRFRQADAALAAARAIHADVFPAALVMCGKSEPDRFSVVQIIETFLPPRGHKLRSRVSQLSDRQWAKVVTRSLDALDESGSGDPVSVALWAGEPFDHSDTADQTPPDYPKSYLKGIEPGPVHITTMMLAGKPAVVTIDLTSRREPVAGVRDLWPLAVTALVPIASDPDLELAVVRAARLYSGTFDLDPADGSAIVVCGPATTESRRAELEAAATETLEVGPLLGLLLDHPAEGPRSASA